MAVNPGDPPITAPEPSKIQLAFGFLCLLGVIAGGVMAFLWVLDQFTSPAGPLTPEDLESVTRKELRPNEVIQVTAGKYADGMYYVFAEYKPILKEAGPIENEMMDAYKAIYTSGLPVARAEIQAWATLVDQYGQPFESIIYSSQLDGEAALPVNWEKLYLVTPSRVFSDAWSHPAIR